MVTTMAVAGQSRAIRSTTRVASSRPRPIPPTSFALIRPSRPAWPSAVIASRGKRASRSSSTARGRITSPTIGSSASRYAAPCVDSVVIVLLRDPAFGVVELLVIHGALEQGVAAGAARVPDLQAFELQQRAHFRIVPGHPQQQVGEALGQRRIRVRGSRHVAVVEVAGGGYDPGGAGRQRALLGEGLVVAGDHP